MSDVNQKRKDAQERMRQYVLASRNRRNKKTAGLRRIAEEEPHEVTKALEEFQQVFSDIAEVFTGLATDAAEFQKNLDLTEPEKTASVRTRVAARRNYARTLLRLANEQPEEIGAALSEVYFQLDDAAQGIEALAERFGLPLVTEETEAEDVVPPESTPPEEDPAV